MTAKTVAAQQRAIATEISKRLGMEDAVNAANAVLDVVARISNLSKEDCELLRKAGKVLGFGVQIWNKETWTVQWDWSIVKG